jgi:hypothetical protein
MIESITLDQLRTLVAAADEGSFSALLRPERQKAPLHFCIGAYDLVAGAGFEPAAFRL